LGGLWGDLSGLSKNGWEEPFTLEELGVFERDLGIAKRLFLCPSLEERYRTAVAVSSYFLVSMEAYREGVFSFVYCLLHSMRIGARSRSPSCNKASKHSPVLLMMERYLARK